jgi:hypothetical protein
VFDDNSIKSRSRLRHLAQKRVPLWVLVLVAAITAAAGRQLSALQLQRDKGAVEQQHVASAVGDNCESLRRQIEQSHLHFGTALAWAVRSALMRNNVDQIDLYFTELVKSRAIQTAVLADRHGKVLATTEKHLRGARFSAHFPPALLSEPDVRLERMEGNQMRLTLPIHGLSRRLGTVLLTYTAD